MTQEDAKSLRDTALTVRSVNHRLRQRIIDTLGSEELNVTDLRIKLRQEQSTTSQHLAILRRSGIAICRTEGKEHYYSIDGKRLAEVMKLSRKLHPSITK